MSWKLAETVGELRADVRALQRDMAMIKRLAGRAILLAVIWTVGALSILTAEQTSDLLAAFLKRLIGL